MEGKKPISEIERLKIAKANYRRGKRALDIQIAEVQSRLDELTLDKPSLLEELRAYKLEDRGDPIWWQPAYKKLEQISDIAFKLDELKFEKDKLREELRDSIPGTLEPF